jgi:hypothetical protein
VASTGPIVHIGFPKTASTWFQKSFYPNVRSPRYVDRDKVNAVFLDANALAFDPEQAREQLGLARGEAGILCEEGLCGYLHNGGVDGIVTKEVAERIKATLPDAQIVIFIRSQPKILVAAYQQYVRAGGTYGPKRYFFPKRFLKGPNARTYKQARFDVDFFLYSRIIALYDRLFGAERVHVFLFEDFQEGGLDFMRGYAEKLGLDVDWAAVSLARRLASYGPALSSVARFFNLFAARSVMDKRHVVSIPGWYGARRVLLEGLNRTGMFGRPASLERLIGTDDARQLEQHYAKDNALLEERRGLRLRDAGYPMP